MANPRSDDDRASRVVSRMRMLVSIVVGGVGAGAGFTHTHDWAVRHGQTGWLAWADAIVIECLVVVAGFEVRRDHLAGRSRPLSLPMAVMIGALGVQMTAQVALAEPTPAGWLVAAMPATSFILIVKLALRAAVRPAAEHVADVAAADSSNAPTPDGTTTAATGRLSPAAVASSGAANLPVALERGVAQAVERARAEGRPVTADDIRRFTRAPAPLAERILGDLLNH
jgi:hypothetical protein